ncbi:hypothetical protein V6N12_031272 [Hibiscus sabdariffa]|uniref:Uncharacterized protein n=1 Tax=Hibiscus sabdariffa TaxID=183260 RepID=A0ABR2E8G1_9ROSI
MMGDFQGQSAFSVRRGFSWSYLGLMETEPEALSRTEIGSALESEDVSVDSGVLRMRISTKEFTLFGLNPSLGPLPVPTRLRSFFVGE